MAWYSIAYLGQRRSCCWRSRADCWRSCPFVPKRPHARCEMEMQRLGASCPPPISKGGKGAGVRSGVGINANQCGPEGRELYACVRTLCFPRGIRSGVSQAVNLAGTLPPADGYAVQRDSRSFPSCEDAREYYATLSTGEAANFRYRVADRYGIEPSENRATLEVRMVNAEMRLPEWSWPGSESSTMLAAFNRALVAHETGHFKTAQDFINHMHYTIPLNHATNSELGNAFAQYMSGSLTNLNRRQRDYDDITRHGAEQSLAGTANLGIKPSANVIFTCETSR